MILTFEFPICFQSAIVHGWTEFESSCTYYFYGSKFQGLLSICVKHLFVCFFCCCVNYTFNNVADLHSVCRVLSCVHGFDAKKPLEIPSNVSLMSERRVLTTERKGRKPLLHVLLWNRPLRHTCVCLCLQIWSAGRKRGSLQSSVQESEWAFGWKTSKPKGRRRKVAFTQQQTYTNSRRCARPPLHLICVNVW